MFKKLERNPMYLISDEGEVFSLFSNRLLKLSESKNGYLVVNLRIDGKSQPRYVHRLVAEVFLPAVEGKPHINHKNANKHDNRIENLEWCTNIENLKHAFDNNLIRSGSQCTQAKLSEQDVENICKMFSEGLTTGQILLVYPTTNRNTLNNIRSRRCWTRVSEKYVWNSFPEKRNGLSE